MHLFDLGTKIYGRINFAGNRTCHIVLGKFLIYVSMTALFMPQIT
tara:strand:+ start:102 stop:236 length:135 start_codon:yes stop_codon:yes gene_type:complete